MEIESDSGFDLYSRLKIKSPFKDISYYSLQYRTIANQSHKKIIPNFFLSIQDIKESHRKSVAIKRIINNASSIS